MAETFCQCKKRGNVMLVGAIKRCTRCGLPLPIEVLNEPASPTVPEMGISPQTGMPGLPGNRKRTGFRWGLYVLAMLLVLCCVCFLSYAVFDDSIHKPPTLGSARSQAFSKLLESLVGVRGEEIALSLVGLGVAAFVAYHSVRSAGKTTRIVSVALLAAAAVAILGTGLLAAAPRWREAAWRRGVAEQVRHAAEGVVGPKSSSHPAIRDKVVVWDYTAKGPSFVQTLLPDARLGKSSDSKVTFVLVLSTHDEEGEAYSDGTRAYRRTLSVAVVDWPEQKVLGVWSVEGESPGMFVMRPADEKGPVIGDTDQPLKQWIAESPARDQ